MRLASWLSAVAASLALAAAPMAVAQGAADKTAPKASTAPSGKPAAKAAAAADSAKAKKAEGAAPVRTTPAEMKKGYGGYHDGGGCHSKGDASDA